MMAIKQYFILILHVHGIDIQIGLGLDSFSTPAMINCWKEKESYDTNMASSIHKSVYEARDNTVLREIVSYASLRSQSSYFWILK